MAVATITDPPSWLRRGTPASFEIKAARRSSFDEAVLRSGYVTEVSILSPGVEPCEPLARVLTFDPAKPRPAAREEVIHGNGQIIRRVYENAVTAVGGIPVRTSARQPLRRSGMDYVIDHPDGSQTIYSGPEGYREALRDGVVR